MTLAARAETGTVILILVGCFVFFGAIGFFILKGYRRYYARAYLAQMRAFDGVETSYEPLPGFVHVVFHTYAGVVVFVHQTEHQFWASPDNARLVLKRLHYFNLTWGSFAYGALLIPILSMANYRAQKRHIARQVENWLEQSQSNRFDDTADL